MRAFLAHTQQLLPQLPPHELCCIGVALARWNESPGSAWLAAYQEAWVAGPLQHASPQGIAMHAWAIARLSAGASSSTGASSAPRQPPRPQWTAALIAASEQATARGGAPLTLRGLAMVGWSLGKLGVQPPGSWTQRVLLQGTLPALEHAAAVAAGSGRQQAAAAAGGGPLPGELVMLGWAAAHAEGGTQRRGGDGASSSGDAALEAAAEGRGAWWRAYLGACGGAMQAATMPELAGMLLPVAQSGVRPGGVPLTQELPAFPPPRRPPVRTPARALPTCLPALPARPPARPPAWLLTHA